MEHSYSLQRSFDGRKQICVVKRFEQKTRDSLLQHSSTNGLISLTSDEYDRNLSSATLQFLAEFQPTHAWHSDVEDQAASLVNRTG